MERREVVVALGLLAAGSAGCANTPRPTPEPPENPVDTEDGTVPGGVEPTPEPLEVSDFAAHEGPDGELIVDVTVLNPAEESQRSEITITTTVDDETYNGKVRVAVDAGDRRTRSVPMGVDYERWTDDRNLDFSFDPIE